MKRTLTTSLMLVLGLPALTLGPWQPTPIAGVYAGTHDGATRLAPRSDGDATAGNGGTSNGAAARTTDMRPQLENVFTYYEVIELDVPTKEANSTSPSRRISLPIAGVSRDVVLVPYSVRTKSYRSTVTTAEGTFEEPAPPIATYKGKVEGEAGSDARLLIQDDLVVGYVRTATDLLYIEPASRYDGSLPSGRMVIYRDADIRPEHRGECGSLGLAAHADALAGGASLDGSTERTAAVSAPRIVEIATEADFEFSRANGSSANAVIEGVINQIDGIFQSELNIAFRISHQHVWATANDPYSTSNAKKLLRQFKREWNRTSGTGSGVSRDVAHLFTGRDLIGSAVGQASVGVVCSDPANAYALSQATATTTLAKIVAHQLGHNLGVTSHDDERGADACDGDGPLMCSGVQNAGANVFSQESKNDILAYVEARGTCLDTGAPPPPPTARRVRGDYDGDGKADLVMKGNVEWFLDFASNDFGSVDDGDDVFGLQDAYACPADYDGDGKDDFAFKHHNGEWFIDLADFGFAGPDLFFSGYGDERAIPVPADYDGDGKADLSVKSNAGEWFIDLASDGFGVWNIQLSGYGDERAVPRPADFDGDGKADLSVKSNAGEWFIDLASDGFGVWNIQLSGYGDERAIPVPADYDGDGKADLLVASNAGDWFIDFASNGFGTWDRQISGYVTLPPVVPGA